MDVNLKTFFEIYISLYKNVMYTARKSFSVLCDRDFANERL